jgi:hypothetical protein
MPEATIRVVPRLLLRRQGRNLQSIFYGMHLSLDIGVLIFQGILPPARLRFASMVEIRSPDGLVVGS